MKFLTNKAAAEKIAGLEGSIASLETDNATLKTQVEESADASQEIVELKQSIEAKDATIETHALTIADQESTIETANDKLSTFDADVEAKTQLAVASLGFKGVITEASKEDQAEEKSDNSHLHGREKLSATFKLGK